MNKTPTKVLVVDDEQAILDMTRFALEQSGLEVQTAANAYDALLCINDNRPDIILMDWMMPGVSGIQLTRRLRKNSNTEDIPIIMLTARVTEDDKVSGLESGADDYLIKPFSPRELVARIKAVLRRSKPSKEKGRLDVGRLRMDTLSRRVLSDGAEIHLGPTDYRLLEFFMENPGRVFSRSQLLDRVWGANVYLEERTVDVHIRRLRKALDEAGASSYLQTARGHGYRFIVED
jgi:two-component system phosphate regulon response regulator PhoB